MNRPNRNASQNEKLAYAEQQCSYWLWKINWCIETGNMHLYNKANRKSTYWLDQMNRLENLTDETSMAITPRNHQRR